MASTVLIVRRTARWGRNARFRVSRRERTPELRTGADRVGMRRVNIGKRKATDSRPSVPRRGWRRRGHGRGVPV